MSVDIPQATEAVEAALEKERESRKAFERCSVWDVVGDTNKERREWEKAKSQLVQTAVEHAPTLLAALSEKDAEIERLKNACSTQNYEICQTLGKVLGAPWCKDDPKNFPGATEADGVCVGDHVAESLAEVAAAEIERLRADNAILTDELTKAAEAGFVEGMEFGLILPSKIQEASGRPPSGEE